MFVVEKNGIDFGAADPADVMRIFRLEGLKSAPVRIEKPGLGVLHRGTMTIEDVQQWIEMGKEEL